MSLFGWWKSYSRADIEKQFLDDDLRETRELHQEVTKLAQNVRSHNINRLIMDCIEGAHRYMEAPSGTIDVALSLVGFELLHADPISPDQIPEYHETTVRNMTLQSRVAYRAVLHRQLAYFTNYEKTLITWVNIFGHVCQALAHHVPSSMLDTSTDLSNMFTVPLIDVIDNVPDAILQVVFFRFMDGEAQQFHIFHDLQRQLDENVKIASTKSGDLIFPNDPRVANLSPEQLVRTYLHNTPFEALFLETKLPITIPQHSRFEHMIVTGGTGHGKTQLLQTMILNDLIQEPPPSIVVVDSQGQMIEKIARLELMKDRNLIILDPRDNPTLNVFDINQQRLARYGTEQQEQVHNHTIETFSYLFNSLLGAELTVRQATLFNYVISLMLALPKSMGRNATLLDLVKLMDDPTPYLPAMQSLDDVAKEFFKTDFPSKQYSQTKEQIRYRLQAILGNRTLARLFLAPRNTVDFFTELNKGCVLLVDTNKAFLGAKNSSYLGKIAISLILQAILERAASTQPQRPVLLFIDEAGEYFDKSIDTFLTEARKQKAGLILAHQYLNQMTQELRASVASNTSIKLAGGVSAQDARAVAFDMRTTPEFLLAQKKLTFACYVANTTSSPISLAVPAGKMEDEPRMTDTDYHNMREHNRARVSLSQQEEPTPDPDPDPDPDHIDL
jgi:hypothetical protein